MDEQTTLKQLPAYETAVIEVEYMMSQFTPEAFYDEDSIIAFIVDLFCEEKARLEIKSAVVGKLMPHVWVAMIPDHVKRIFWLCRQATSTAMDGSRGKLWRVHLEYRPTSNRFKT